MGSSRGGVCADHALLQGGSIPFAVGFCSKQARVALQKHRREKLGLLSSVGQESRLDLCLAFLAVLFLLYYLGVMLPHPTLKYAEDLRRPLRELIVNYIKL